MGSAKVFKFAIIPKCRPLAATGQPEPTRGMLLMIHFTFIERFEIYYERDSQNMTQPQTIITATFLEMECYEDFHFVAVGSSRKAEKEYFFILEVI